MHLRLHAFLTVVGAVLLLTVFMPPSAQAQDAPTLTVTPSAGLEEGDTVTVTGGPFPTFLQRTAGVGQCFEPIDFTDVVSVLTHCELGHAASFDAEGNLVPTSLTVHEVFAPAAGFVFPIPTHDCTVSNDCLIGLFGFLSDQTTLVGATAPIRFGPEVPITRAGCLSGGWRNLANDQGQSFRNQGQCVSFVVAHRR
jgi:hypothetical protein